MIFSKDRINYNFCNKIQKVLCFLYDLANLTIDLFRQINYVSNFMDSMFLLENNVYRDFDIFSNFPNNIELQRSAKLRIYKVRATSASYWHKPGKGLFFYNKFL